MPGAQIAIDQDRPGPTVSYGTPGIARNDLWAGRVLNPRSAIGGNTSYAWTLLAKPVGSTAVLSGTTLSTCAFTPDLSGSYRIQLVTNGGGAGNVHTLICGVTLDVSGDVLNRSWRLPAAGESGVENNFSGQTRGWAESLEFILNDLLQATSGTIREISANPSPPISTTDNRIYISGLIAPCSILLPTTPFLGERHRFIDADGGASSFNITVGGNGSTINGASSFVMSTAYAVREVEWTGAQWNLV